MQNDRKLNAKIIRSVFLYETRRITVESLIRIGIFILSLGAILVFGGVIFDIIGESEMGGLLSDFFQAKEYSFSRIAELWEVISGELPQWLVLYYVLGVAMGCILIVSIVRNWKSITHKVHSIATYWFRL